MINFNYNQFFMVLEGMVIVSYTLDFL